MYATIRWRERGTASPDDLARAGRTLAARLGALAGFVACLLLETPDGGYAAIGIFEDRGSLAEADELVAGWSPVEMPALWADPLRWITGEVVVQKGL
jgi:hypothetical protein